MANSTGDDGDNILIEAEQKGFDYFLNQTKLTVFEVLYVLRKDEESEESMFSFYIQTGLDYFQMHTFPFNQKIYYLWKSDNFLGFMLNLVNLFSLSTYVPNISYFTLLVSVYVLLGIIMLIILDIIYVSYSFSQKRFRFLWPLFVLRSVTSLVVTVLFLPITETLTSVLSCWVDPETGKYVIYGYNEISVECWKDWHIFHALITLVFIILFVGICAIVAYAFFEPGMTSDDRTARQDSKGEVAFIINKVTCQLMYCFLGSNESWILVIITFLLAVWLFYEYNFEDPFYDYEVGKFYSIISTYYLYANIMLLLCKIFENSSFTGGLIAWVIGLPFLVSIMLLTKKSKIETLVKSQNKFRSGEQLWGHIRYVLQLIQKQENDKNSYMLLIGYVEKHKEICEEKDCYFKTRRKSDLDINEIIRGLIQELDKMFKKGLQKFPRSSELRIFYALFLIERKHSKLKALEQFELVHLGKPALYQQFITYRYKKIIKDNQASDKDGDKNDDIVEAIAFKNHLLQCEEMIGLSANLHKEFWIELKEDQPDLGRLMQIGAKISKATKQAKDNYNSMQKINPTIYQSIKVFGNFMLNVLNDSIIGNELLKQAKTVKEKQKRSGRFKTDNWDLDSQPIPFLQVSAKKVDPGVILNMNTLFTTFFGYQKEELLGKKINLLMPQIYSEMHDKYLIECFDNIVMNLRVDGQIDSTYLDTDQNQYFKHKNGYLIQMIYKVNLNLEQMKYLVTFRSENQIKSQVIFIINTASQILEMSSSAIIFFDLELRQIRDKKILLTKYIPELFKGVSSLMNTNTKDQLQSKIYTFKDNNENIYQFSCVVTQIILQNKNMNESQDLNINSTGHSQVQTGQYLVKLEKLEADYVIKKNTDRFSASSRSVFQVQTQNQSSHSSSTNMKLHVATSLDSQMQQPRFDTNIEFDQNFATFLQDLYSEPRYEDYKYLLQNQAECDTAPTYDYAENIVIRRLIKNQIVGIDEETEQQFLLILEEEEEENSLFRQNLNQYDDDDDYRLFYHTNSHELIRKTLSSKNHRHAKIEEFQVYSIMWITFIVLITILQYYFCYLYFSSYKSGITYIQQINNELIDIDLMITRVLDLCFQTPYNFTQIKYDLDQTILSINSFNALMNSENSNSYYTNDAILQLRLYDDLFTFTNLTFKLESAILFVATQALNMTELDEEQIPFQSNQIQNVIYNSVNVIQATLESISQQLYNDVTLQMNQSDLNLLLSLGVLVVFSTLAMTKFTLLMLSIKEDRENILFLFLDIPQINVQELFRKVDRYIKSYVSIQDQQRKNELEGYESSEGEHEQVEVNKTDKETNEEDTLMQQQLNRKKIIQKYRKNKLKGNQGIIIQFVLIALCTLVFAVYNIISSANERSQIQFLLPQFYQSTFNINRYGQFFNSFKLMLMDNKYLVNNISISDKILRDYNVFVGNQNQLQDFSLKLIQDNYQLVDNFMTVYFGDICKFLNYQNQNDDCNTVISGNLQLGVYNVEQYYLEYFRIKIANINNLTNIENKELYEIDISLFSYIRDAVLKLTYQELDFIVNAMDSTLNIQLILVIVFICLLLFVFATVWVPFLNGLNVQTNQNIEMLNMIPLEVIKKKQSKTIRRFLKRLIKSMDIEV